MERNDETGSREKILKNILRSPSYKKSLIVASVALRSRTKSLEFINKGLSVFSREQNRAIFVLVDTQFLTMIRMVSAYFRNTYPRIAFSSLLKILSGIVYLVFQFDFITDFIPMLGLTDDVLVLVWVVNSVSPELKAFEKWEATIRKTNLS